MSARCKQTRQMSCIICLEACATKACHCSYMHMQCRRAYKTDRCSTCSSAFLPEDALEPTVTPTRTEIQNDERTARLIKRRRRLPHVPIVEGLARMMAIQFPDLSSMIALAAVLTDIEHVRRISEITAIHRNIFFLTCQQLHADINTDDTYLLTVFKVAHRKAVSYVKCYLRRNRNK